MIEQVGAACFGAIIGWFTYFINRFRGGEVRFADLTTLIGILGGGVVLTLFPAESGLFGAYGIGLAIGFFGYFLVLAILVYNNKYIDSGWFLDGRSQMPKTEEDTNPPWHYPRSGQSGERPMGR